MQIIYTSNFTFDKRCNSAINFTLFLSLSLSLSNYLAFRICPVSFKQNNFITISVGVPIVFTISALTCNILQLGIVIQVPGDLLITSSNHKQVEYISNISQLQRFGFIPVYIFILEKFFYTKYVEILRYQEIVYLDILTKYLLVNNFVLS